MKDASTKPTDFTDQLLVASPELCDPNFRESLVYITSHDHEGAMGLILNRPVGKVLSDIMAVEELPGLLNKVPLFFGGPVASGQVLLSLFFKDADCGAVRCQLNPDATAILEATTRDDMWLRAFVGYAGWTEGQLEAELIRDDWKLRDPDHEVFHVRFGANLWPLYVSDDQRWRRLLPYLPDDVGRN